MRAKPNSVCRRDYIPGGKALFSGRILGTWALSDFPRPILNRTNCTCDTAIKKRYLFEVQIQLVSCIFFYFLNLATLLIVTLYQKWKYWLFLHNLFGSRYLRFNVIDIWDQTILCRGLVVLCIVQQRAVFWSISTLEMPKASTQLWQSKKCLQILPSFPWGQNNPHLYRHRVKDTLI